MYCKLSTLILVIIVSSTKICAQVVLNPVHYELSIEVDHANEVLRGSALILLENPSPVSVNEASLLLYRLLSVESVLDDLGEELVFDQNVTSFVDFGKLQVNHILVTLAEPIAPGERRAIRILYEGHLLGYSETGMRYIKDRIEPDFTILREDSYAYPQPGYPSYSINREVPMWNFTYSASITVQHGFTVANGGHLDEITKSNDATTYRYSSLKTSWRMDFAIANYSRLSIGPIQVFHLPGSEDGAAGVAEAAKKSLALFSEWFGPLPGSGELTFIEIPDGWGSQSDVTTIIQTSAAFQDARRHREVYHEISHLWNIAPSERPSPRWDEGLASFLEYLVTEELTGRPIVDARATQLIDWLRSSLPDRQQWREVPMVDYGRHHLTDLSYSVGAIFFDLLYRLTGQETFNSIITRFVNEYGTSGGSSSDFRNLLLSTTTIDLSQFINDWLYTTVWTDRIEQSVTIHEIEEYYRLVGDIR